MGGLNGGGLLLQVADALHGLALTLRCFLKARKGCIALLGLWGRGMQL
jgi:hypothetical protein